MTLPGGSHALAAGLFTSTLIRRRLSSVRVVMFQIDGLSGTGKSTLAAELARRGCRAVDSDAAFGYFADPVTGVPCEVGGRENWMWDGRKLRAFARASR